MTGTGGPEASPRLALDQGAGVSSNWTAGA